MKLMNLYFALGFTVSMSVALVACNKNSDNNNPQPPPGPVVTQPAPMPFPNVRVGPAGTARVNQPFANVICVSTALDRNAIMPMPGGFDLRWDTSKSETFPITHPFVSHFGNIELRVQPPTIDSNSNISAEGYMELKASGATTTLVRSKLVTNIKFEINDEYRETNFTVECNVVDYLQPAQVKTAYTCNTGNVQQVGQQNSNGSVIRDFRINSKPEYLNGNKALKFEVNQSRDELTLTLAQNENRTIKVSVPFGHEFIAQSSFIANAAIDCQASNINATQQTEKK